VADTDLKPRGGKPKGMTDTVNDLVELLKAYAKQETVGPLQRLGRYLGFGLAGSVVIATGCILLLLGLLRLLQTETGTTFTGSWSWAPYAITLAAALIVAAIFLSFIKPSKGRPK
jgi:hypothetical protein